MQHARDGHEVQLKSSEIDEYAVSDSRGQQHATPYELDDAKSFDTASPKTGQISAGQAAA